MRKWYFVRYRLYGINNVMHFSTFSQYQNWVVVMEKNFEEQFTITQVIEYDV